MPAITDAWCPQAVHIQSPRPGGPRLGAIARGAHEAPPPTETCQVVAARRRGHEALFELLECTRVLLHSPNPYSLGSLESRTYLQGDYTWRYFGGLSIRPSPSLQLSVAPEYRNERGTRGSFSGPINRQFLITVPDGRPEVFGQRYIFGLPDNTQLSMQFRASYTFKPDMTLDVYAEPFAASGRYDKFGETLEARAHGLRIYGTNGTTIERLADGRSVVTDRDDSFILRNYEFNVRSFRSNVVLQRGAALEWRPGSTLFVVWQQNRENRLAEGVHVGPGDLFESLSAPGDNILTVKTTLWISR